MIFVRGDSPRPDSPRWYEVTVESFELFAPLGNGEKRPNRNGWLRSQPTRERPRRPEATRGNGTQRDLALDTVVRHNAARRSRRTTEWGGKPARRPVGATSSERSRRARAVIGPAIRRGLRRGRRAPNRRIIGHRATRGPSSCPLSQRTFERSASRDRSGIAAHRLESPSRWSASSHVDARVGQSTR